MMTAAQYGRMRHGRCADTDVYIGCHADVLSLMDARCSGRETCSIAIPDATMHQQQPCPNDMMAYLEASFTCLSVLGSTIDSSVDTMCTGSSMDGHPTHLAIDVNNNSGRTVSSSTGNDVTAVNADPAPTGYLSSQQAALRGHGTSRCPWSIVVGPGQRIELTLIDFALSSRYQTAKGLYRRGQHQVDMAVEQVVRMPDVDPVYCHVYASVIEMGNAPGSAGGGGGGIGGSFTMCASDERETQAYVSQTNRLTIEIPLHAAEDPAANFVIKYAAIGCIDLIPPKNAWVTRINDHVTVTCNFSTQTWHLVCKGNSWVGRHVTHECEPGSPSEERLTTVSPFPAYGLILAVLTGVIVGSLCGFSLLAAILWCKRRSTMMSMEAERQAYDVELMAPPVESTGNYCKSGVVTLQSGDYAYTHVWQPLAPGSSGENQHSLYGTDGSCRHNRRHLTRHEQRADDTKTTNEALTASDVSAGGLGMNPRRYLCKDHLYESPSLESAGAAADGTLQWSPYYWHGATPCLLVSRQQHQNQSPAQSYALPTAVMDSSNHQPYHHCVQQQQQQQQHDVLFQRGSSVIPLPTTVPQTDVGNYGSCATMAGARDPAMEAGQWFISPVHCSPTTDTRASGTVTSGYEPVTCRSSSSDPDVTHRRSENHYT